MYPLSWFDPGGGSRAYPRAVSNIPLLTPPMHMWSETHGVSRDGLVSPENHFPSLPSPKTNVHGITRLITSSIKMNINRDDQRFDYHGEGRYVGPGRPCEGAGTSQTKKKNLTFIENFACELLLLFF